MSIDSSPRKAGSEASQTSGFDPHQPQLNAGKLDPIVVDGISYIPSNVLLTGISKVSIKDNRAFAVTDTQGEALRLYASTGSELGVYFNDTRYLSIREMTFNGTPPVALSHELRFGGSTAVYSMTNQDLSRIGGLGRIPRDTFLIRKIHTLQNDILYEMLEIKNFASQEHEIQVEQWAGARFDDVFEVRGYARTKRGRMLPVEDHEAREGGTTVFSYDGLDGVNRRTFVQRLFGAEKIRVSPSLVGHFVRVKVPAKGTVVLRTMISFDGPVPGAQFLGTNFNEIGVAEMMDALHRAKEASPFAPLKIECDNAIIGRAIRNAEIDIHALLTEESSGLRYPYAGIPWFSAPFGRDGIITAYQLLPWAPDVAKGVLSYVFESLGTKFDAFTDEQPGKVFHEIRRGEMARTREVPFIPYYGSVDSTPLALVLLHEYVRWTMDVKSLREWWPDALRALEWVEKHGDADDDGFIEYAKQSPNGLVNQGWKDSHDSIMHADGRLAVAPIRLCEVQGYAFRARMGMSALAALLGDQDLASRLRMRALQLRAKFASEFWDSKRSFVHLALDGDSEPCAVKSSNMGHCLWSLILSPDQARSVTSHLASREMFTGHGIRTLAADEAAYNPLSYHNGSVWPHDTSLIMEGMRNYGHVKELEMVASGLISVLEGSEDFRLPELFCGFRKRGEAPPVPYQVACKPQAWAAGSVFLMLKSMLGIGMDTDQNYLVFNSPTLTSKIGELEVQGLRGRDWEIDLRVRRAKDKTLVEVLRKSGSVRVMTVK